MAYQFTNVYRPNSSQKWGRDGYAYIWSGTNQSQIESYRDSVIQQIYTAGPQYVYTNHYGSTMWAKSYSNGSIDIEMSTPITSTKYYFAVMFSNISNPAASPEAFVTDIETINAYTSTWTKSLATESSMPVIYSDSFAGARWYRRLPTNIRINGNYIDTIKFNSKTVDEILLNGHCVYPIKRSMTQSECLQELQKALGSANNIRTGYTLSLSSMLVTDPATGLDSYEGTISNSSTTEVLIFFYVDTSNYYGIGYEEASWYSLSDLVVDNTLVQYPKFHQI